MRLWGTAVGRIRRTAPGVPIPLFGLICHSQNSHNSQKSLQSPLLRIMRILRISLRFKMLSEVAPAVTLTRVVVAPTTYPPTWPEDDVCRGVGVSVPGTFLEHPTVPVALPFALSLDGYAISL